MQYITGEPSLCAMSKPKKEKNHLGLAYGDAALIKRAFKEMLDKDPKMKEYMKKDGKQKRRAFGMYRRYKEFKPL